MKTLRAANFTTGNNSTGYTLTQRNRQIQREIRLAGSARNGGRYAKHPIASPSPALSNALRSPEVTPAPRETNPPTPVLATDCNLSANTTYYLVLSAPNSPKDAQYKWRLTQSTNQTNTPSNAGWQIGDRVLSKTPGGSWVDQIGIDISGMIKVAATVNPPATLTASGISGTGATLTIAGHTGDLVLQRHQRHRGVVELPGRL